LTFGAVKETTPKGIVYFIISLNETQAFATGWPSALIKTVKFWFSYTDEGATLGLGGWIEPRFFDAYVNQSIDVIGEMHSQAIIDYINIIGNIHKDQIDRKTIEEWTLFGDPSIKLGE